MFACVTIYLQVSLTSRVLNLIELVYKHPLKNSVILDTHSTLLVFLDQAAYSGIESMQMGCLPCMSTAKTTL